MSPGGFEPPTPAFLSETLEITFLTKYTHIRAVLYQAKLWAHFRLIIPDAKGFLKVIDYE